MRDDETAAVDGHDALDPSGPDSADATPGDSFDESITDEIAALIDDGRTYAEAEIAFQKTRASIAGKSVGFAAGYVAVALIVLHVAVLALAVGMVMALAPLVTIWGAIAIVVGVLLALTAWFLLKAKHHASRLGLMFGSSGKDGV